MSIRTSVLYLFVLLFSILLFKSLLISRKHVIEKYNTTSYNHKDNMYTFIQSWSNGKTYNTKSVNWSRERIAKSNLTRQIISELHKLFDIYSVMNTDEYNDEHFEQYDSFLKKYAKYFTECKNIHFPVIQYVLDNIFNTLDLNLNHLKYIPDEDREQYTKRINDFVSKNLSDIMDFEGRNHPKYLNKYGRSWIKEWSDAIQIFCFYNYLSEQLYSAQKDILYIQERILETVKQIATDNTNITEDVEQIVSNKLDNEMNDINNRLSKTESSLLSNKKQIDVAIENSISLSDEKLNSKLGEAIESIQTSYDKEFKNVQAQLNETENSKEKLDTKIDTVTNTIANQIADVQNQLNQSNSSIGNIDNKINNVVDTKIDTVANKVANQIADVRNQLNQSNNSIGNIDNKINNVVDTKIDTVTNKVANQIADVRNQLNQSNSSIGNMENKINNVVDTKIDTVTNTFGKQLGEVQNLVMNAEKSNKNQLDIVTNQFTNQLEDIQKEINQSKGSITKIDNEINKVVNNEINDVTNIFGKKIDEVQTESIKTSKKLEDKLKTYFQKITKSIEDNLLNNEKEDRQRFNDLTDQINQINETLKENKKNMEKKITTTTSGVVENETNISALNEQFKTLSESITSSQTNAPEWFDTYKNIIERNSGNISGIEKNKTNISALNEQFKTLSESIQSSQDKLTGFMSAFDDDTLKNLAQASDISDRLDVLQQKYEESEIVKVDPTLFTKYDNFERELRTFESQLDSQQEQINKTLIPYVSQNWDNINKHVDDSLKPYIDNYINQKFIEEIKDSIRTL